MMDIDSTAETKCERVVLQSSKCVTREVCEIDAEILKAVGNNLSFAVSARFNPNDEKKIH